MKKNVNLEEITFDEYNNPVVYITKKLKDSKMLKVGRIRCYDHQSFMEGLEKYVSKHSMEWNLKNNETVGFLIKGSKRYYNYCGPSFKTVAFYKIKNKL